jgi:serine/threonine protein kinase
MDVLVYLASHPREVLPRDRIIRAIWPDTFVTDEVLTNAICELRRVLDDDAKNSRVIETIPKRGYRLIAEVSFSENQEDSSEHFRIVRKLDEGGMGVVHLAQDTVLNRPVALKFLRPDREADEIWKRRLRWEARTAASLDHPYICKVYETGSMNGRSFIAMEYVGGETLSERLKRGPIPLEAALRIGLEISEALEVAHRHGIVHRDIKPSNLMFTGQGHIKITDFGIAKRLKKVTTESGEWTLPETAARASGTPAYMSPEQLLGEPVDCRTDQFLLGLVLYQMVTGVHPFLKGTREQTIAAVLQGESRPLQEYLESPPELLQQTISKMLARDPRNRYDSVHEITAELSRIMEESVTGALRAAPEKPARRRFKFVASALTILTLLVYCLCFVPS